MTIDITIDGDDELLAMLARVERQAGPEMVDIANATGEELEGNIVKAISRGQRTGHIYTHYMAMVGGRVVPVKKRAVPHQASAAGEAPKTDGGRLVGSIRFDQARGAFGAAVATVGSKLDYARWLEYGTRKIKPRPVWEPEAKKAQKKFNARIKRYLKRITR